MWGRRFSGRSGRRSSFSSGRRGYSYATVVLGVSAAILLILYLTGHLSF
jgi:hypothetical protein